MWAGWRQDIIDVFPPAPGLEDQSAGYLAQVDEGSMPFRVEPDSPTRRAPRR